MLHQIESSASQPVGHISHILYIIYLHYNSQNESHELAMKWFCCCGHYNMWDCTKGFSVKKVENHWFWGLKQCRYIMLRHLMLEFHNQSPWSKFKIWARLFLSSPKRKFSCHSLCGIYRLPTLSGPWTTSMSMYSLNVSLRYSHSSLTFIR